MQDLFLKEAVKYNVLPIDDRVFERLNAALVGRPDIMSGRTSITYYEGMNSMSENVFINTKGASHTITAEVTVPKGGGKGVIIAQAGRFGGWSLYLKDGKPTYSYNVLGLKRFDIAAKKPLQAGKNTIRYEFAYDGGGMLKGGMGTIFVNGKKVAQGRIEQTQQFFSADEGGDVGEDLDTPVVPDYGIPAPYKFTGKIAKVIVELQEMKKAENEQEKKLREEVAYKKAMSD
jgi:arylsulfatase